MLKSTLALITLLSAAACMSIDSPQVTRQYTGSMISCPGVSGVSAQYLQPVAGLPVRCGPQTQAPVTYR